MHFWISSDLSHVYRQQRSEVLKYWAACSCGSLCFERPIADGAAGVRGLRIRASEHKRRPLVKLLSSALGFHPAVLFQLLERQPVSWITAQAVENQVVARWEEFRESS